MHAPATTEPQSSTTRGSTVESGPTPEWCALLEFAAPRPNRNHLSRFLQSSFNWTDFLGLAEKNGLTLLVAKHAKNLDLSLIPPASRVRLQELQRSLTVSTLQLTAELFRVLEHFAESGIDVLLTKGPALSVRCYGDPSMRQYGDLDLIVRETDIRRATQAMVELGYEPRVPLTAIDAKKSAGEYAFRKSGSDVLVEFHTERTFRYHPRRFPIEKIFERHAIVAIDGRDVPALSLEDELLLICIHGAKHFWERLMWIADVAALVSARQAPDGSRAFAVAREVGAERMLRLGLRLASDVLRLQLPTQLRSAVRSDRALGKLAAQITERLGAGGVHPIGLLDRAIFRMRMRGGFFPGAAYLLRLSLSPTEEDWTRATQENRSAFIDALGRPLRLAKKHSRPRNG